MASKKLRRQLEPYYREKKRRFPWRETTSPYATLVAEIMLQQTQASRVVPYFEKFIHQYPTVKKLSAASPAEVLQMWQGLGYNRRALFLHHAAKKVMVDFGGKVPRTLEELIQLPGVGVNTAGAILAYAYNLPAIFIETNIRKTIIHLFFSRQEKVSDQEITETMNKVIDQQHPREWYWAMVDYGSMLGSTKAVVNNRSAHHQKQNPFVGSKRFTRSQLLKYLLRSPRRKDELLARFMSLPHVAQALDELLNEGFCVEQKGVITIRE